MTHPIPLSESPSVRLANLSTVPACVPRSRRVDSRKGRHGTEIGEPGSLNPFRQKTDRDVIAPRMRRTCGSRTRVTAGGISFEKGIIEHFRRVGREVYPSDSPRWNDALSGDAKMTRQARPRELAALITQNRRALLAIAERHGLCNVRVFGSMARAAMRMKTAMSTSWSMRHRMPEDWLWEVCW